MMREAVNSPFKKISILTSWEYIFLRGSIAQLGGLRVTVRVNGRGAVGVLAAAPGSGVFERPGLCTESGDVEVRDDTESLAAVLAAVDFG